MTDWEKLSAAEREEIRFQAAIAKSTAAVLAVADYLRAEGYVDVEVLAQAAFVDRKIFKDAGADLRCRVTSGDPWRYVEVKQRKFNFDSAQSFPFISIIVDRVKRTGILDLYFSVSRDCRNAAVITRESRSHWNQMTVHDHFKGYDATVYECPKMFADFVVLAIAPQVRAPAPPPFNGRCSECGAPGLYVCQPGWACNDHRRI